jgi:hypothetical protein
MTQPCLPVAGCCPLGTDVTIPASSFPTNGETLSMKSIHAIRPVVETYE